MLKKLGNKNKNFRRSSTLKENYQTAEIYFYLYHVAPLNIAVSNYCVN